MRVPPTSVPRLPAHRRRAFPSIHPSQSRASRCALAGSSKRSTCDPGPSARGGREWHLASLPEHRKRGQSASVSARFLRPTDSDRQNARVAALLSQEPESARGHRETFVRRSAKWARLFPLRQAEKASDGVPLKSSSATALSYANASVLHAARDTQGQSIAAGSPGPRPTRCSVASSPS